jgi:TonB family protein
MKPIFTLPPGVPVPVITSQGAPPPLPVEEAFCTAPHGGSWHLNKKPTPEISAELDDFTKALAFRLSTEWYRHIPLWATSQFSRSRSLMVRFDLQHDGSVRDMVLMMSAGRKSYDDAALNAIRNAAPYPPPAAVQGPVHMCLTFHYNPVPVHKPAPDPLAPKDRAKGQPPATP